MNENMPTATEALQRLRDGNERFVSGECGLEARLSAARRAEVVASQHPFAIVLGCSDSRVPAEIVFDHGIGDLFVIRVAGNVVASSQIGSVEFAASHFGTRLVVVLGHSNCGAIAATIEALESGGTAETEGLRSIMERVTPAVEPLLSEATDMGRERLIEDAVRANVRASAEALRRGSSLLESLARSSGLAVVGAEYSLASGRVDFFNVPDEL